MDGWAGARPTFFLLPLSAIMSAKACLVLVCACVCVQVA